MRRVKISLAGGLLLTALAVVLVLAHSPMTVARRNGAFVGEDILAKTDKPATFCQREEFIPRGTDAIRVWLGAYTGPAIALNVLSADGKILSTGHVGPGWTGRGIAVPVTPVRQAIPDAIVCLYFQRQYEAVDAYGSPSRAAQGMVADGDRIAARMWIEYLTPGSRSWASQLLEVARRMELGRSLTGSWIVLVTLAMAMAIVALTSLLILREVR